MKDLFRLDGKVAVVIGGARRYRPGNCWGNGVLRR